jgi:hypothetical protein
MVDAITDFQDKLRQQFKSSSSGARGMAQVIEDWPNIVKALGSIPST